MGIQKRDLITIVLLSIITLGIYSLYWMYKITDELNNEPTPSSWNTKGGTVVIFSIITLGIYTVYWAYKIGEKLRKDPNDNRPILYLILQLIVSIVAIVIIQNDLNKILDRDAVAFVDTNFNEMYVKYGCINDSNNENDNNNNSNTTENH